MMLLQAEKELGCGQREVLLVSGSFGPMQQEAGAEQCWQLQLLPEKAERIWRFSKVQNTGRVFKEPVLEWHREDTCPVQRYPPWAVPSRREGQQQWCQLEGICSHGVKMPLMLITRALVLQLHMRFIQYASLRVYLDPSWL